MSNNVKQMQNGGTISLMYLNHGRTVPDGWKLADKLEGTHHSWFAVLLVEKSVSKAKK